MILRNAFYYKKEKRKKKEKKYIYIYEMVPPRVTLISYAFFKSLDLSRFNGKK